MILAVPVQPGADQARRWLEAELAKAAYARARPTLFDLVAKAIGDWFQSLFEHQNATAVRALVLVGVVVVVALVVVALLIFGLPRLNRRSRDSAAALFGEDDTRTADELRRAAAAALAAGEFDRALLDAFRALARGLDERTVVALLPGTTASAFAADASAAFPDERPALRQAAAAFDGVRYGGRAADAEQARTVVDLDARIARARPRPDVPVPS